MEVLGAVEDLSALVVDPWLVDLLITVDGLVVGPLVVDRVTLDPLDRPVRLLVVRHVVVDRCNVPVPVRLTLVLCNVW